MVLTRRLRFLTVLLSLCALLFAQSALAAYACPGALKAAEAARMAEAGMPCAQDMARAMDEEQPGLCHAHCQSQQQAPDTTQVPALAAVMDLGAVLQVALPAAPLAHAGPQPLLLHRSGGPPLAIRHCCLRI